MTWSDLTPFLADHNDDLPHTLSMHATLRRVFDVRLVSSRGTPCRGDARPSPRLVGGFQATLTSICFGFVFSLLGRWTFNTPSLNSAFTFSASAPSGRTKLRTNLPYARSTR